MTSFDIQLGPVRGVPLYLLLADTCFLSWRAASCGTGSVETPGKAYIMPSAFWRTTVHSLKSAQVWTHKTLFVKTDSANSLQKFPFLLPGSYSDLNILRKAYHDNDNH
jgi:hypothetical protein